MSEFRGDKMKHAGEIFREMRKARKLSQTTVSEGFSGKSTVSDFENMGHEIGYITFYQLINRINVSLEEFQYEMNDHKLGIFDDLLERVTNFYNSSDVNALKKLLVIEEARTKNKTCNHDLTCVMIKNMIGQLDSNIKLLKNEQKMIVDYLLKAERWGYYELVLFGNTMPTFTKTSLITFSKEAISRSAVYQKIPTNKLLIIKILLNVLVVLIHYDEFNIAINLKKEIEKLIGEDDIFAKTVLIFVTGGLELSMGDAESGKIKMKTAIDIFKAVGSLNLANTYQQSYDKAVNELEK